ncbi:similar to Saccharomyces cerevisiae YBR034C HMT1 Nuclear SAM-dependent mono-and asymmetric arginine dimethylating methyltransferase that modifies hnRNPs [Maudiozyma saulgeensis]|uniref:Similar to Saccharomyces cerevisiae YBR034C HMT1 Nuclear SAM-dependent mono-and asymmetric arginine dimethylating methyltransferase that modifies hnRNPs n=1 Tax=Maudiozyma saulgeensis TaxID=1789683 RepID=A0A1X7R731_9SACH|nr:similar to Saccharomyces cerevisiae YBR034C HMT1 Nuclear SAM-dependent mono-and asymmetric arginine dimethylating methyltransferase that modifies hnRNPs [Kazachstania saulgeensis]
MSKTTKEQSATEKDKLSQSEQHYFTSYDHFGIHEEMLQDTVRTLSYRNAIVQNKDMFKDKIVLDVGCGTGILSMFAAKNGAKHVIGVDMSSIIEMAQKIVDINGFSDKITLLRGKLEDIVLPYQKVDIIVSEWMGYFLLYESMLDTVLYARDRYLAPGGLIFPDKCSIHLAGLEDSEYKHQKLDYWQDVYGFDYTPFIPLVMKEPIVDTVESSLINTTRTKIIDFDLNTVTLEDLKFNVPFKLQAKRQDTINGLIAWFDNVFPAPKGQKPIEFSTGPYAAYTHWKQTVFYLEDDLECEKGDILEGTLFCAPNGKNNRDLDVKIKYDFKAGGVDGKERSVKNENTYLMH